MLPVGCPGRAMSGIGWCLFDDLVVKLLDGKRLLGFGR